MRENEIYKKEMGVLLDKVEDKFYVVYDYNAYEVNEIGARILDLCNGKNSIKEITEKLSRHFNVDIQKVSMDVISYIDILKENELIVQVDFG